MRIISLPHFHLSYFVLTLSFVLTYHGLSSAIVTQLDVLNYLRHPVLKAVTVLYVTLGLLNETDLT